MIKSQQSEEENEGFFKPVEKVIKVEQCNLKQFEGRQGEEQGRGLGEFVRPSDFKGRVIDIFKNLHNYPDYLMGEKCQQGHQEIGNRIGSQKISQKYLTMQEKYLNVSNFKMIYSKISDNEFNNYIFSLNYLTNYSQKHYISQSLPEQSSDTQKNLSIKSQSQNQQNCFQFDSNFQSGNLLYAFQDLNQTLIPTFDLIIQNDTNTKGYNQWFYFSISKILKNISIHQEKLNTQQQKSTIIKIRIVNFIKKHLMFENGVRPVACFQSEKQWKFIGRDVQYKKSFIKRNIQFNGSNITKNFYTLSFLMDFQQENNNNQKVYVALNYPYPFKRAISLIDSLISSNTSESISIQKQTLCHTMSNNQVPYLIISSKPKQKQVELTIKSNKIKKQKQKAKYQSNLHESQNSAISNNIQQQMNQEQAKKQILLKRKKILLFARQHPGETVGSFVLEGFLKQLMNGINNTKNLSKCGNQDQKQQQNPKITLTSQNHTKLLKQYTIYVFPMINVDGVIYGNFRTNLAGFDLNRQWIEPNKWLHPQIYHLKKLIANLKNIHFVLDFHGHSRKLNSFIYACNNPVPILLQDQDQNTYPNISMFRLFPYILSKQTDLFSIKDCTYTISKDKIKTARINTFKSLNFNPYIFTLETGFYGFTKNDKKFRYKINDFFTLGKAALQSLKILLLKPKKTKQILKDVQNKSYLFDMWAFQNKQDLGSESNPSEDELNPIEIKTKVLAQDMFRQRQRKRNEILKRMNSQNKKTQKKKQRKNRLHRKVDTELKSQRIIIEVERNDIKIVHQKEQLQNEKVSRKEIKSQNQKSKGVKIEYYPDKKRNLNSELFNVVAMKEAVLQKPQFYLPLPNNRQKATRAQRKMPHKDFKTTSNLLGTGLGSYQNKMHRFLQPSVKSNPPTLQMLEINNIKRDVRIQSSVDVSSYEDSKMRLGDNFMQRQNKIKDLFFSLHRHEQKNKYSRQGHKERIFVVRDNKIVKVVNNVSKIKSNSTIMQGDLNIRHRNLKKCQDMMSSDDKTLIEQIKEQRIDDKVRKKKVFLNPIQY